MRKLILLVVIAASMSACALFFPFGYDSLSETRLKALCHVAFACCTPIERQLFASGGFVNIAAKDEGACVAEAFEDDDLGFIVVLDQGARDAIARGTAEYDGEAAERCSRPALDAVNSCDADTLFNSSGSLDVVRVLVLADPADQECFTLATRNYTRGLVDDGDECDSSFDCKDFGSCVDEEDQNEDGTVLTTKGKCVALHAEGDECDDGIGCQPGLTCNFDEETPVCEEAVLIENGEPCFFSSECESGNCQDVIENGTCFDTGLACDDDIDCGGDDFCDGDITSTCEDEPEVTIEVCNGQQ